MGDNGGVAGLVWVQQRVYQNSPALHYPQTRCSALRNQLNEARSQASLSTALSNAGVDFEQTIKDYHSLLEEAKAKLQQSEQEKRELRKQLLQGHRPRGGPGT